MLEYTSIAHSCEEEHNVIAYYCTDNDIFYNNNACSHWDLEGFISLDFKNIVASGRVCFDEKIGSISIGNNIKRKIIDRIVDHFSGIKFHVFQLYGKHKTLGEFYTKEYERDFS